MKNIGLLTEANLCGGKSQAVSLLAFVLLTALLFNIGLVVYFNPGRFFDERAEQLNSPHFVAVQPNDEVLKESIGFIENYPGVTKVETQNIIFGQGEFLIGGKKNVGKVLLARCDPDLEMGTLSLIEESYPLTGNAIYIPYFLMTASGYKLGDDFILDFSGTELTFVVAGGTEDIMFGGLRVQSYRFYISDEKYTELQQRFLGGSYVMISARMSAAGDAVFLQKEYDDVYLATEDVYSSNYDNAKSSRIQIPLIMAAIVTAFAIILLIVSLIVIRFRINTNIEEGMANIGVLKAVGYRNRQIVAPIVIQYGLIALVGSILGIVVSQLLLPVIGKIMEPQLALKWEPGFDMVLALFALTLSFLTPITIALVSARRINRLHPLTALRGGITTHNFRKNSLPLDKTRGALSFLLASKQILQNKKQAAMVGIIIASVAFASFAGVSIYYNLNVEKDAFAAMVGGEVCDALFTLKDKTDSAGFVERIAERGETRKINGFQNSDEIVNVDGKRLSAIVVGDCSLLEGGMLVRGRYPIHDNEIALGGISAKVLDKNVNDMVIIKSGAREMSYLVTGIVQSTDNNGLTLMINKAAFLEIQPEFEHNTFYVYLKEGADAKQFAASVKMIEGSSLSIAVALQELIDSQLGSIGDAFAALAAGVLLVTLVIVALVLYMVIKATILRRKRELGIQKALGFTTVQLMNQISLNLTPVILAGIIIGGVVGYIGFNPLLTVLMQGMGIVQVDLPIPFVWTSIVFIALLVFAYAVSMLIALRVRRVSAYSLLGGV